MNEFEVAIYNADVRACVRDGRRHRDLTDEWADIHYIEIEADTESEARATILRRYPVTRGYVIEAVNRVPV
jgi:hypothetical protein